MKMTGTAVAAVAADVFDVSLDDVLGTSRRREYVVPRFAAYKACIGSLGWSITYTSRYFGVDRTSVKNGLGSIDRDMRDPDVAARVMRVVEAVA
jgi:chromosomal replication initiation ATPase DnaA